MVRDIESKMNAQHRRIAIENMIDISRCIREREREMCPQAKQKGEKNVETPLLRPSMGAARA